MICAGIDAGSRTIKIVLMDARSLNVIAKGLTDQGIAQGKLASELFNRLIKDSKIHRKDVSKIVATGYGRNAVGIADTTITEITCHAVGVRRLMPETMTIIDIGGEDSKLIRLDKSGKVRDFAMNDRCAAGTGRFLEIVARRLGVRIEQLGRMAEASRNPAAISSMCVVFAETEIIGLLAAGALAEDIIAGVQAAIAARVMSMIGRKADLPIVFTGGVAMISGMDKALESALNQKIAVAPDPQMTGAIGAAILACKQLDC